MIEPKRILIVDDSAVTRVLIKASLLNFRKDWVIIEASNADEAQKKLETNDVDLISIDYNMPGINGFELLEIVQEKYPEIKVAILTANIQDSFKEKVKSRGVSFLEKPVTDETIEKIIEICLN
ncbi:MAG: response regulator [Spirochaetia bacterium]|nr:response regulator [Spirochaetia bacterium]